MGRYLIKNGHLIDPANGIDGRMDILIQDGMVCKVAGNIDGNNAGTEVVNASGKYIMPGFIDLHVHLREPGFEYKETVMTGARAAAKGGVTTICPMPNTKPVIDTPAGVKDLLERAKDAPVHILPIGAITSGQEGIDITDIEGMKEAGAVAISEDGKSVMDSWIFMQALHEAARTGMPVFSHCEDTGLVDGGVMNYGAKSEELGLPGIINAAEDVIVARDIFMAKEAGCRLHLCHCSTADSVLLVEMAKKQGLPVTAEACPHHFTMSDDEITEDDGRFKMNPPLRGRADVEALKNGLKNGIMDIISTDHAPHGTEEKAQSMLKAPFGITGLETSFALGYTVLVKGGYLTLPELVRKMSVNPAKVIGIDKGNLAEGKMADLVIADLDTEYEIDSSKFESKGKNTPFNGMKVYGRIEKTFVCGRMVYCI
ncbi:MAG: dihydroorotase [Lachnospiraceae bacterium]|nr:dihydroorotase [Lachnospiraceae bacterium]